MVRLRMRFALALLGLTVGSGVQAHAFEERYTSSERVPSSKLVAQAKAGKRSALVIGNGAYTEERLDNAVNDAEAVALTLKQIGFSVTLKPNADKRTIDELVDAFSNRLGPGDIALFYYSGHGVQVDGESYLVPINAQLRQQADAQYDAVPLGKVINAIEATSATTKIIILDACRNNPFYRSWRTTSRSIITRGLAAPLNSGNGTLIAFSTAPGKVASDRIANGKNSPFTTSLLRHIGTANVDIGQVFRRVRSDVLEATNKEQVPWVSEALVGEVFLNPQISSPKPSPIESQRCHWQPKRSFDGRVGELEIENTSLYPITISLWHPDATDNPFKVFVINGLEKRRVSIAEESSSIGSDWGIQIGKAPNPVCTIFEVAQWIKGSDRGLWRITPELYFK